MAPAAAVCRADPPPPPPPPKRDAGEGGAESGRRALAVPAPAPAPWAGGTDDVGRAACVSDGGRAATGGAAAAAASLAPRGRAAGATAAAACGGAALSRCGEGSVWRRPGVCAGLGGTDGGRDADADADDAHDARDAGREWVREAYGERAIGEAAAVAPPVFGFQAAIRVRAATRVRGAEAQVTATTFTLVLPLAPTVGALLLVFGRAARATGRAGGEREDNGDDTHC